jgi:CMP-N-acetylneuraminic acid synthetase
MKNIAIIPARGGSKRLPSKNILSLGGIPLIAHSIIFAQKNANFIDEIYVTTDDEAIKRIAMQYGAKVIDRPNYLSGDHEPTLTALKHCVENISIESSDTVFVLQPTNPLRPENLIKDTFRAYEDNHVDSLMTVTRNFQKLGKVIDSQFIPFNYQMGQRSQDLEPLFFENGLLYISKVKLLLEEKIISKEAFPYEVNHIFAHLDIDTQEDFEFAEYLIAKNKL